MPAGGARTRSGPAPDPTAPRTRSSGEWLMLPAEGRVGDEPRWPLTKISDRERYIWREMWTKPQAVAWESHGLHYEVALMVRRMTEAEKPEPTAAVITAVRQAMDSLGITIPGLRANRWKISEASATQGSAKTPARRPASASSARGRLTVVPSAPDGD
jgi:hypothetical protein